MRFNRIGTSALVLTLFLSGQAFAEGTVPNSVISKGVSGSVSISDLNKSNPYYAEVSQLIASGFWSKSSSGTISPDKPVERIKAAKDVLKLLSVKPVANDLFSGLSDTDSAIVGGLLSSGLILPAEYATGFQPQGYISRYEVINWAAKALEIYNPAWAAEKANFDHNLLQQRDGNLIPSKDFYQYSQDPNYSYLYLAVQAELVAETDIRGQDSITVAELAHILVQLDKQIRNTEVGISANSLTNEDETFPESYLREFTSGLAPLTQGELFNEVQLLAESSVTIDKDKTQKLAEANADVMAKYQNKEQYLRTSYERVKLAVEDKYSGEGIPVRVLGSHRGFYYQGKELHNLVSVWFKDADDGIWYSQDHDVIVPLSKYSGTATDITEITAVGERTTLAGVN